MKKLIVVVLALAATLGTFAQTDKQTPPTKKEMASQVKYTCTMHPEVISDKPGKCPKCGMALVKKTGKPAMDSSMRKMPMHKMDTTKGKKKMTM